MSCNLNVFLLGGTSETGKEIIKELAGADQVTKVTLISRRNVELPNTPEFSKFVQKLIDFEQLANNENVTEIEEIFKGHDVGFCSLGTTKGKAGSQGFYRVDHDYIVSSAQIAKSTGTKHFSLVSALSANKNSHFLYPKTKGEVESEITEMGFERFSIWRPALIMCDREESRPGEFFARQLFKLDFLKLGSVEAKNIAKAMVKNIFTPGSSTKQVEIFDNRSINQMAK